MIFISHNHRDKPIVEPIAIRLSEIFGRDKVFYDSWSMQPGDGIIDKMDEGLSQAKHFFFFISESSLKSQMVKLEWQNAIFIATKGQCKIIPVRLDSSPLPSILSQTLYIDLYSNGIDAAVGQIVNVIQGNTTFSPSSTKFSNLTYTIEEKALTRVIVKISASHYLEPIPTFLVLVTNKSKELKSKFRSEGFHFSDFIENQKLSNGQTYNAMYMRAARGLTPSMPLYIEIESNEDAQINFKGLLYQKSETTFEAVPIGFQKK